MPSRTRLAKHALAIAFGAVSLFTSTEIRAEARLPDTEMTQYKGTAAWLIDPVTRYRHGVLGDAVEAGGFQVQYKGKLLDYKLDTLSVFEDRRVRLTDLTGDGKPEAILVKSYLAKGAALAVYSITESGIEPLAESEPIGQPHRWLNPVGVIAHPGEAPVIAAVITPHLTGSLRTYKLQGKKLVEVGRLDGYTNHIIHTGDLDLARIDDADGDGREDVIIPDIDRTHLAVISVKEGKPVLKIALPAGGEIVALDRVNRGTARYRLANGRRLAMKLR